MAIIRRHRLRLPPELALQVKTAAMTEGLASLLDPGFVLAASFAPYAARLLQASPEVSLSESPIPANGPTAGSGPTRRRSGKPGPVAVRPEARRGGEEGVRTGR